MQRLVQETLARPVDLPWSIARAGVAVFTISLLIPMLVTTRGSTHVLIASAIEIHGASLRNDVAVLPRRALTPAPITSGASEVTVELARQPAGAPVATVADGAGAAVLASWYGPGFYENRLPCWQWLQANGLPIQLLPDTWGVAHRTLPCGAMVTLTHGANTVTVPVVDRGPYVEGREIDLAPRVKVALGCTDLCTVLMQIR